MLAQDQSAQTPPEPAAARDCLAEITLLEKANGPFTKRIWLQDGKLASDRSACRMAKGTARRVRIDSVQALADFINGFTSRQAYTLGRLKDGHPDYVRVVTADKLNGEDPSVIARTKNFLVFKAGEPGLVLLDFDPKVMSEAAAHRMEECGGLWGALCEVLPEFEFVACVERASTSSGLRNQETAETFGGSGGWHIVIPVLDAADIPRFLSDLHDRLWLDGSGWGMVVGDGKFLARSLVDKSVGSPERPVFEGPPILEPPLAQQGRYAVARDGYVLDTRLCRPLSDAERVKLGELRAAEERRLLPERLAQRASWSAGHIERLTTGGMSEAEARVQVDRWIDGQELSGAFPLPFDEPSIADTTVEAVLAAPDNYVGKSLSDPVEGPSYGRGTAILYRRSNGSLWIKSFAHGGMTYDLKAVCKPFAELLTQAQALGVADITALRALIDEMLASLPKLQHEPLLKVAAKAVCIPVAEVRKLVMQMEAERAEKARSTPQALEAERIAREHALEAARIAREQERQRLSQSCSDIAMSPTLLADMEAIVHRLGVIGENAAIRGHYLTATSRMLGATAIAGLRRGASASGKNYLPNIIHRLIPPESIIQISSATPMALIYVGEGENDVNALKGKLVYIPEAIILTPKANGDEHPMAAMLRILLSEGKLDHHIPVPRPHGPPKTVHIRRDGPIALSITSARENIEPEMLTRLMSSDADEFNAQTTEVVKHILANNGSTVGDGEIQCWLDFQRWLELEAPYEVVIPFLESIAEAWLELVKEFPAALQLRIRRDATALKAAVEASAVLHKAQRKRDAAGRIIAEIGDYENAHAAFNDGMAALYDLKPTDAIAAAPKAVADIMKDATTFELSDYGRKSYKITIDALRRKLGIQSSDTTWRRLQKLIDLGALEEDTTRRGQGRGSPRWFYELQKETFERIKANVFPATDAVQAIWHEGGGGSNSTGQDEQEAQVIDSASTSCSASHSAPVRAEREIERWDPAAEQEIEQEDSTRSRGYASYSSYPADTYPPAPMENNKPRLSYRDVGPAQFGAKCVKCGKLGVGRRQVEIGGKVEVWHLGCAEHSLKEVADQPWPAGLDEPGLSPYTIRDLAHWYQEEAYRRLGPGLDQAALDRELRKRLAELGVFGDFIADEFERVMQAVFSVSQPMHAGRAPEPDHLEEHGAPPVAGSDGIPLMITRKMKAELRSRGFTDDDIRNMLPQQANDILADNPTGERSNGDEPQP